MPHLAVASFSWQHELIGFGAFLVVLLVALVGARIYKMRHPDFRARPADEQNPVLRGLGQVAQWLFLLWPW